jgi:hypothetical protein
MIDDVGKTQKTQIVIEARVVHYLLVSQQQKLYRPGQPKGQPAANAATDGPQGRMASLSPFSFAHP